MILEQGIKDTPVFFFTSWIYSQVDEIQIKRTNLFRFISTSTRTKSHYISCCSRFLQLFQMNTWNRFQKDKSNLHGSKSILRAMFGVCLFVGWLVVLYVRTQNDLVCVCVFTRICLYWWRRTEEKNNIQAMQTWLDTFVNKLGCTWNNLQEKSNQFFKCLIVPRRSVFQVCFTFSARFIRPFHQHWTQCEQPKH